MRETNPSNGEIFRGMNQRKEKNVLLKRPRILRQIFNLIIIHTETEYLKSKFN